MDYLTVCKIKATVSKYFDVDPMLFDSDTREQPLTTWRMIAIYFSRMYSSNSLKTLGTMYGNRDHSSILHALRRIDDLIDSDKRFRAQIFDLKSMVEKDLDINEDDE